MRIAYVCADPGVPVFGRKGSSVHVQEVIRAMVRHGADVTLFANRFDGEAPPDLASIAVETLPQAPKGDPAEREQRLLAGNLELSDRLRARGPFDLVYERYSLWSHAAMEHAAASGVPGVLEVNAPLIEEQANHRDLVDRPAAEDVARRVFSAASVIAAVSEPVRAYVESYPATSGKVMVVPNGVNPERFPEEIDPAILPEPGTFVVGFVGTLKRWHGLPVLVDAFERLHTMDSGMRLLIVGDGNERDALEADVAARGLQQSVTFTGAVAPADVPAYLASMDAGVAPYPDLQDFYFSPLKVFEYMAAGLPVVASDIGQMTDAITHRVTGMLCAPGDATALADALGELRVDHDLRLSMGKAARSTVLKQHTWDGVVSQVLDAAGAKVLAVAGGAA